ncbi:uncharacterized protein LOC142339768 [Convolutriloba macropyga]|uniref:uncharacterized protein LOC142339768 n=1 Tax=Convolutriloba macropyga TaxID=536237 RepID=UPI003F51C2F6
MDEIGSVNEDGSDVNPGTDETEVVACSACGMENEDSTAYYRCNNCPNESEGGDSEVATYCDVCVASHVRKKHNVVDYRGYEPAICSNHKLISLWFCELCNVAICSYCLMYHKSHSVVMVTESAGAARKDIFLHLGVVETNTKKLNVVKDEITQACSENEMQLKVETQFVDELLGKLKQSLVNRIELEHEKHSVKSKVNDIEELITTSDASQNECLSYLRQSDGRMVEAFVRSKSENASLTQKTDRMLNEQKKYVNHDFIPLNTDEFVKCTAEKFMREIYLSRVKECLVRKSCESSLVVPGSIIAKRQVKTFWLGSSIFGGFLFEINEGTDDAGLYLKSWSVDKSSNYLIKKKRVKVELRKCEMPSTSVQPYSHKVFYFTASGFDGASRKQKYVYLDSNNGQILDEKLFPYFEEQNISVCKRAAASFDNGQITFDKDCFPKITCRAKPKPFFKHCWFDSDAYFQLDNGDLVLCNLETNEQSVLAFNLYKLPEVDYVYSIYPPHDYFLIWCCKNKAVHVMKRIKLGNIVSFELVEILLWSEECSVVEVRIESVGKTCKFAQFKSQRQIYCETSKDFVLKDIPVVILISCD